MSTEITSGSIAGGDGPNPRFPAGALFTFHAVSPPPFLAAPGEPAMLWATWLALFDNFLLASGGDSLGTLRKGAVLLSCLGVEGQAVFATLEANAAADPAPATVPACPYEVARKLLTDHFTPRVNVVAERYNFRSRGQLSGETTRQWVTALRKLAATAEYGALTDEFIRDQVVEKTTNPGIRRRLLLEDDLTLKKALVIAETIEDAEAQARRLQNDLDNSANSAYALHVQGRGTSPGHSTSPAWGLPRPGGTTRRQGRVVRPFSARGRYLPAATIVSVGALKLRRTLRATAAAARISPTTAPVRRAENAAGCAESWATFGVVAARAVVAAAAVFLPRALIHCKLTTTLMFLCTVLIILTNCMSTFYSWVSR